MGGGSTHNRMNKSAGKDFKNSKDVYYKINVAKDGESALSIGDLAENMPETFEEAMSKRCKKTHQKIAIHGN